MKKYLILLIACLLSSTFTIGQTYHPFPDSNAVWSIATVDMGNYTHNLKYGIIGDTIINLKVYKKIGEVKDTTCFNPLNSNYFCAIRDYNKCWYFVQKGDTTEYKLYDFNSNAGDTIMINNPWAAGNVSVKIDSTDSILILNKYRKRYYTSSTLGGFQEQWIEGIGSNNGLYCSAYYIFDSGYKLLCFHLNDTLYYMNSPPNMDCNYITGINYYSQLNNKIEIYPNPCIDEVFIKLQDQNLIKEKYNVEIFSPTSNMVYLNSYTVLENLITINLIEVPQGILFIRIRSNNVIYFQKIVKL